MRFIRALSIDNGANAVIAEIKPRSPKYGDLMRGRDPFTLLDAYEKGGARAISYITESRFFGGDMRLLKDLCSVSNLPVLRKDFILDIQDIDDSVDCGVDAVLFLAGMVKDRLGIMLDYCHDYGIAGLVETSCKDDIDIAKKYHAKLIGINNRDITKLEKDDGDISRTLLLSKFVPKSSILISESGIGSISDVREVMKVVDGILVGTAFMLASNPEKTVRSFVEAI
jgi:indole-3-glycerol phosphate synthase